LTVIRSGVEPADPDSPNGSARGGWLLRAVMALWPYDGEDAS
jgi:hypothetical protein